MAYKRRAAGKKIKLKNNEWKVETGSEVVCLRCILGPSTFLQHKNVRGPKESQLFNIITVEITKYFAQGTNIQVQAIIVYIFKNGNKAVSMMNQHFHGS